MQTALTHTAVVAFVLLLAAAFPGKAHAGAEPQCALSGVCGDVNGSGTLSATDALAVLRASVGQSQNLTCQCEAIGTTTTTLPSDGFTDNGNGTITASSGLMWEKLSNDGSIHDKDNSYTYVNAGGKIGSLNFSSFGGHTDWRLPTLVELRSIADFGHADPSVDPVFNSSCALGCTVTQCSCTKSNSYWSAASNGTLYYWGVTFTNGSDVLLYKHDQFYVRAVRGVQQP